METIVVALVSFASAIGVSLINNAYQHRKQDEEQDKRITENTHMQEKAMLELQRKLEQQMTEMQAGIQQELAILSCKFDDLTLKVEKHNQLVERTYKLESDMEVVKEKQSAANNRIKNIEEVMRK